MVKKMKSADKPAESSSPSGSQGSHLASAVKESAQQIWLAGMGAFSKAQEEGTKVFEALVKEGQTLQKKTQGAAEEKINEVSGKMSSLADTVSAKAGQNWDKLEAIFEARTAKAMSKLGVPTAKDVAALQSRVDELAATVARMAKGTTAKAPAKAATKSAAKPGANAPTTPAAKAPAKRAARKAASA